MKSYLIIASFLAIAAINVNGQELLMGTLVRQGSDRNEALGDIPPENAEEVKVYESKIFHFEFEQFINHNVVFVSQNFHSFQGKEVAKGDEENVAPENELMMGQKTADFPEEPTADEVKEAIAEEGGDPEAEYESKKGSLLDSDVKTGK